MKMNEQDILDAVTAELENSAYIHNLQASLSYYLGRPNGTEVQGRSTVTSTDVADVIEWLMPSIMESFTQNNEVVVFDPVHQGDELQAEIEYTYVYEVLMKQNPGFVILHTFIKDALMQRNGLLKVYYEKNKKVWLDRFTGLDEVEFQALGNYTNAKVSKVTRNMDGTYDADVEFFKEAGKICIVPIPPEEFRYNNDHNSIDLSTARFTAHVVQKTMSDLIKEGYSRKDLEELPKSVDSIDRAYRFNGQGEPYNNNVTGTDESTQPIEIVEAFMQLDINDDGIAELVKITAVGSDLTVTKLLSVDEIDALPWISATAILMSHKFQGLSLYDRIREIQDQKTTLWRNIFDNIYFQNNQRTLVLETMVNLDDLLVSRPGGIIRTKNLDAVRPLITPPLAQGSQDMMTYLDQVRGGRSGVTPDGASKGLDIGDRVGSEGVKELMTAKEALAGLIIRVIAETGIKPLCCKIRDIATQHVDSVVDLRFRGNWVKIDPKTWKDRTLTTVRVGTGSGNVSAKKEALQTVLSIQKEITAQPGQALVNPSKVYRTLDEYCKLNGLVGAYNYFVDPQSEEGKQQAQQAQQSAQQQQQQQAQMTQVQLKAESDIAQAEVGKVKVMQENVQLKAQLESIKNQLAAAKQQYDAELSKMEHELNVNKNAASNISAISELQFKYHQLEVNTGLKLLELQKSVKEFNSTQKGLEADETGTDEEGVDSIEPMETGTNEID